METIMEKARGVVDRIGNLPAIPSVVLQSMSMLNDPSVTVKKIQEQILLDQSLTAFILKVANSALYGLRKEVSTVSYAINLMGYNSTRSILMAFLTKNLYQTKGNKYIQNVLWKHSLAAAVTGRKIAETAKTDNIEEVFIACLLHDIGKGVLFKNCPEEFEEVVTHLVNDENNAIDLEFSKWGFSHVEVGYLLMKNWRFSDDIIEGLVYHHNLAEFYGKSTIPVIVSLANKIVKKEGISFRQQDQDLFEAEKLGISEEKLEIIIKESLEETETFMETIG